MPNDTSTAAFAQHYESADSKAASDARPDAKAPAQPGPNDTSAAAFAQHYQGAESKGADSKGADSKGVVDDAPCTFKPDGEGRTIEPTVATALSDVARELKIGNEAAQKLVDRMRPALDASMQKRINEVVDGWQAETHADPYLGGENATETIRLAKKAVDYFGTPSLRKLLGPVSKGGTGLGVHKELVRFFVAVGRELPD